MPSCGAHLLAVSLLLLARTPRAWAPSPKGHAGLRGSPNLIQHSLVLSPWQRSPLEFQKPREERIFEKTRDPPQ